AFAIDVERARAFEWSRELGTWSLLDPGGTIVDRTLAVPLSIQALVQAVKADDAMAAALLAKKNPVLLAAIDQGRAAGQIDATARAIVRVLERRQLRLSREEHERIFAARDLALLEQWLDRAAICRSAAELFGDA